MPSSDRGKLSLEAQVAVNSSRLDQLEETAKLLVLKNELQVLADKQKDLVTKTEFWPVKTLVYGAVGPLLLAALGAFMKLVFKQ